MLLTIVFMYLLLNLFLMILKKNFKAIEKMSLHSFFGELHVWPAEELGTRLSRLVDDLILMLTRANSGCRADFPNRLI